MIASYQCPTRHNTAVICIFISKDVADEPLSSNLSLRSQVVSFKQPKLELTQELLLVMPVILLTSVSSYPFKIEIVLGQNIRRRLRHVHTYILPSHYMNCVFC